MTMQKVSFRGGPAVDFRWKRGIVVPPARRAEVLTLAMGLDRQAARALKLPVAAHRTVGLV